MTLKEFKNAIKDWGMKYSYEPIIHVYPESIKIVFEDDGSIDTICEIHKSRISIIDLDWSSYESLPGNARSDLFKIVAAFAATEPEDRKYEEREDNEILDLITHKLEAIQTNAEDVMSWIRILNLENKLNNLENVFADLEKLIETNGDEQYNY